MSQKKTKALTNAQATELKWFCRNVVGVSEDFHKLQTAVDTFNEKIERLNKTCDLIEKFFGEELKRFPSFFDENEK